MRIIPAGIAILFSLACFGFIAWFLAETTWASVLEYGLTQALQNLVWQSRLALALAFTIGFVFLCVGVSLLARKPDPPA